jgi:hypothetical protein
VRFLPARVHVAATARHALTPRMASIPSAQRLIWSPTESLQALFQASTSTAMILFVDRTSRVSVVLNRIGFQDMVAAQWLFAHLLRYLLFANSSIWPLGICYATIEEVSDATSSFAERTPRWVFLPIRPYATQVQPSSGAIVLRGDNTSPASLSFAHKCIDREVVNQSFACLLWYLLLATSSLAAGYKTIEGGIDDALSTVRWTWIEEEVCYAFIEEVPDDTAFCVEAALTMISLQIAYDVPYGRIAEVAVSTGSFIPVASSTHDRNTAESLFFSYLAPAYLPAARAPVALPGASSRIPTFHLHLLPRLLAAAAASRTRRLGVCYATVDDTKGPDTLVVEGVPQQSSIEENVVEGAALQMSIIDVEDSADTLVEPMSDASVEEKKSRVVTVDQEPVPTYEEFD